jgi:hypothetical protein
VGDYAYDDYEENGPPSNKMTQKSSGERDSDNSLWLILKTIFPIDILSEATDRLLEPEWDLFFQKNTGIRVIFCVM